jgi:hypothetical protein
LNGLKSWGLSKVFELVFVGGGYAEPLSTASIFSEVGRKDFRKLPLAVRFFAMVILGYLYVMMERLEAEVANPSANLTIDY